MENNINRSQIEKLSELFSYKAEWLKGHIFDLYKEPAYFPELTSPRPCMLIGGRGTGKTTTLKGLSYEGRYFFNGGCDEDIVNWHYYGIYYRVNTNRVTNFAGPELSEAEWIRLFAHYFNLLICESFIQFLIWFETKTHVKLQFRDSDLVNLTASLHLENCDDIHTLSDNLGRSLVRFEAQINNIADNEKPLLSVQGAPIDVFFSLISKLPNFQNKHFFILLDEYENFLDYQQQVINTLIKHSGSLYSFKIGIRELGLRRRNTLNIDEQLISPADYDRIDISEKLSGANFKKFAEDVCNTRLQKLDGAEIKSVNDLFQGLSEDEEAEKLGVIELSEKIIDELSPLLPEDKIKKLQSLPPLYIYFFKYWSDGKHGSIIDLFNDYCTHPQVWTTRFENHKYGMLFTLKSGKRGIRKYYCGWDVISQVAGNNIRYLLELVDRSIRLHIEDGKNLAIKISPEIQTIAAQRIGQKNLSELEGLSVHGAKLTKLLLGLGRVFQVMAFQPSGHAPEVNQFHLSSKKERENNEEISKEVDELLKSSIRHLALIRTPGNKLTDEAETREYDYMIHPIFSAFFVVSYRKKRKMNLINKQILGLVNNHQSTIREILNQSNRIIDYALDDLPEQLSLFEDYYDEHN